MSNTDHHIPAIELLSRGVSAEETTICTDETRRWNQTKALSLLGVMESVNRRVMGGALSGAAMDFHGLSWLRGSFFRRCGPLLAFRVAYLGINVDFACIRGGSSGRRCEFCLYSGWLVWSLTWILPSIEICTACSSRLNSGRSLEIPGVLVFFELVSVLAGRIKAWNTCNYRTSLKNGKLEIHVAVRTFTCKGSYLI